MRKFAKTFGVLVGIAMMVFGGVMLAAGAGTGPCGKGCGLQQAFLQLLGQPLHNLAFGMVWVILGAGLVVLPLLHRKTAR